MKQIKGTNGKKNIKKNPKYTTNKQNIQKHKINANKQKQKQNIFYKKLK